MGEEPTGLRGQAAALAAGEVSSHELVEAALERIVATQPTLNAFKVLRSEQALAEAREADRRLADGERLPLLGVPIAVKDDMDLAGLPTAFGCEGDFPAQHADGAVALQLRAAGAVIVGKTNTPEFGQWPFTEGPAFGVTRNPWSADHTPGGSSGGAAAAVAAGLLAAAPGSDGAGSVRIPAAWTNLVGIKPQRGRISTWPSPELFAGLTTAGPLARTVADAGYLLDVLAGNRPTDRDRVAAPPTSFLTAASTPPPRRLRIAIAFKPPFSGFPARLDPVVRTQIERLGRVLAGLGHHVEPAEIPYRLVGIGFLPRSLPSLAEWAERVPDPSLLDPRTSKNARQGRLLRGTGLRIARADLRREQWHVGRLFRRFDVVLTPTTATPPPRVGSFDGLSNSATDRGIIAACPYAWPWNVLGWPGVNVPAGMTPDGLPLGAQLLGPAASEPLLLSLAGELEAAERWFERRPPSLETAPA